MKTSKIDPNFKPAAGKSAINYNAVITLLATPTGKYPAQAGCIIKALVDAKDHTLTVGELVGQDGSTESALEQVGLVTVQTPMDIWSFYRQRLINDGFISIS
jgi:hypothetical protein